MQDDNLQSITRRHLFGQCAMGLGSLALASLMSNNTLGATVDGRVIHHSGDNLLVDIAAGELDALKSKLTGWVVSPQQERIAVPDTRRRIA